MLQNLRDKAQGWIAWVIIGMIGITFVLFGTGSMFQSGGAEEVVAKVGNTKISAQQLDAAYKRFLHQPGSESLRQLDPSLVKKDLLQSLIDEVVLMKAAVGEGMRISSQQVTLTLNSIPFFIEDGHFSPQLYARFLSNTEYTDHDFRVLLRDSLIKQQLQQGLMQTSFALPSDTDELIKFILQTRDIRYLVVERAPFEKDIKLTHEDIKQFYEANKQDFQTEEQISLEYIHLSAQELMDKYQPKEDDISNFYKENKNAFNEPERIQIAHILVALPKNADAEAVTKAEDKIKEIQEKLKNGQSFSELAKEYSDDKGSSSNGGTLEWLAKGEMVPEFEEAAFSLKNKDEVSNPVRTEFGFHLIRLVDRQKEKERSFESVKNDIIEKLKRQMAEDQLATLADQLNELTYDHPDSLQPASDKLGLPVQSTDLFTAQQGPKESLLQNPTVLNAAFSAQVKDDKNNSEMLKLDNDNYLVLRVVRHIQPKQKSLNDVTPEIEKTLMAQKSDALAHQDAEKIYKAIIAEASDPAKIKSQYAWKEKNNIARSSNDVNADLIENAFAMPTPGHGDKGSDFKVVNMENGDYAIVWLTKVQNGEDTKISHEEKENYGKQLAKHYGELEYAIYTIDLLHNAKVEKHLDKI